MEVIPICSLNKFETHVGGELRRHQKDADRKLTSLAAAIDLFRGFRQLVRQYGIAFLNGIGPRFINFCSRWSNYQ